MCVQSIPGGIGRNAIAGTKYSSEVLAAQTERDTRDLGGSGKGPR